MDFCGEYPRLDAAQAERFRRVVSRLLSGHVLSPGSALAPDPDWRFAERHHALIDAYLTIGGWSFELDPALRIARAVHLSGEQRVRFNKLESLTTVMLRLVYHEAMQQASELGRCALSVGELRERLVQAGRPLHQLQRRALYTALRKLQRHSLITLDRGFQADDDELIVVSPVIEKVLPADRIAELNERVRAYVGAEAGASESEEAEGEAEEAGEVEP
jgi:hypothetical protein